MSSNRFATVLDAAGTNPETLRERLRLACAWITETAQVRNEDEPIEKKHPYQRWVGAIKSEYRAAESRWWFFGPVWHTGQAVKALVMAHRALGDPDLLVPARLGAEFIAANTRDGATPDEALVEAYEDEPDKVCVSGILESLDGLRLLQAHTPGTRWETLFRRAAAWIVARAWIPGQGLFRDLYDPAGGIFVDRPYGDYDGRPLLDDAILLKAFRMSGDDTFRRAFFETADRLLADEEPAGNWVRYGPCNRNTGCLHPRHAYWWGYPMFAAYADSGERKYLDCALRACRWYAQAQRRDGGLFRGTYQDFNTDSFGHATSGIACAMRLFRAAMRATGSDEFVAPLALALGFCLRMQFTAPRDANMRGAILEKVLPPDGSDRNPYHLRDVGTIFFVQAVSELLQEESEP